jgi:hypothetical protein
MAFRGTTTRIVEIMKGKTEQRQDSLVDLVGIVVQSNHLDLGHIPPTSDSATSRQLTTKYPEG